MAKFFVGMRVWLVISQAPSPGHIAVPIGDEGRITRFGYAAKGSPVAGGSVLAADSNCTVNFERGGHRSSHTDRLEPILPEGHTPSIYSYEELMDKCREGVAV